MDGEALASVHTSARPGPAIAQDITLADGRTGLPGAAQHDA
jgi:hypothetical protein